MPIDEAGRRDRPPPLWPRAFAASEARSSSRPCIEPRFDYGREAHKTQVDGTDAVFERAVD